MKRSGGEQPRVGGHVVAQAHEALASDAGERGAHEGTIQPHLEQIELRFVAPQVASARSSSAWEDAF